MGYMIAKNKKFWKNKKEEDTFIKALRFHLMSPPHWQKEFIGSKGEKLEVKDVTTLFEAIEVLMFIEDTK